MADVSPLLALLLLPAVVLGASRVGVTVTGTTVGPGFSGPDGKAATSCPAGHPYPLDGYMHCCMSRNRTSPDCNGDGGSSNPMIRGEDDIGCCPPSQIAPCPASAPDKCKMHPKGYERPAIHILLFSETETHDWSLDPKGKKYPDRALRTTPLTQGSAGAEYPTESGTVVLCGGQVVKKYSPTPKNNIIINNNWDHSMIYRRRYMFSENTWSSFPPLNEQRRSFAMRVVGATLWSFGGGRYGGGLPDATQDTTEYYDEGDSQWKQGPALPKTIRGFGCLVMSGVEVLIVGGFEDPNGWTSVTDDVYLFNVLTGEVSMKSPLPTPTAFSAVGFSTLADGKTGIAVVSGAFNGDVRTKQVHLYDLESNIWVTSGEQFPSSGRMFLDCYVANFDKKIWIFGGSFENINDREVHLYHGEASSTKWSNEGTLPQMESLSLGWHTAVVTTVMEPY